MAGDAAMHTYLPVSLFPPLPLGKCPAIDLWATAAYSTRECNIQLAYLHVSYSITGHLS